MVPQSTTSTTSTTSTLRAPSLSRSSNMKAYVEDDDATTEKFPDFNNNAVTGSLGRDPSPRLANGSAAHLKTRSVDLGGRWMPRRQSQALGEPRWTSGGGHGHDRQKSLSDALRTIKARQGSVSQNAHEIADALKAPVSPRLIVRAPSAPPSIVTEPPPPPFSTLHVPRC